MAFANVTIMGNLGKDVKMFKYNGRNGEVEGAKFSLAVSKGKDDKKTTSWFDCVCYTAGTAKIAKEWLAKGKCVVVRGELGIRKWEGKEGKEGTSVEVNVEKIEFVPNGDGNGNGASKPAGSAAAPAGSTRSSAPAADPVDDDCPF